MKIAPSILTADFTKLGLELKSISSADYIHIDIMDGNFVPNISFGPAINKQIAAITEIPLDVHLMVLDPLKWIDEFSVPNVEFITVHYESNNYKKALEQIRRNQIKTGLSIKPKTKVEEIYEELKNIDMVLIMSVEPGFGGQKFMEDQLEKVRKLVKYREQNNLNFLIEIDGGINGETYMKAKAAGVDIAVAGSYVFNNKDRNHIIESMR